MQEPDASINVATAKTFNPDFPMDKADASEYAVGAVLQQDGQRTAFEPRTKSDRETYYPAYESRFLPIVCIDKTEAFHRNQISNYRNHATLGRLK